MSLIFTPEFPPVPGKIETVDEKGIHHLGPNNGGASSPNILEIPISGINDPSNGEPDQSYTVIDLMADAYREGVNEA